MSIKELNKIKFLHLNHDDIEKLVDYLYKKILKDQFQPNLIVAISRGGFEPARLLCDKLKINRLTSIQIQSYVSIGKLNDPKIIFPISVNLEGYRVLIVDDVSDTGQSIKIAKQHIQDKGADSIKTATLHIKPKSAFIPDYYASNVTEWVIYPWEIKETIHEIIEKNQQKYSNNEIFKEKLIELGFLKKNIKRYFTIN